MAEYIEREAAIEALVGLTIYDNAPALNAAVEKEYHNGREWIGGVRDALIEIGDLPAANVVEIPDSGIGELSDGYHTFNGLYYQRMVLFAALVNAYNDKAWKSWRHEDGKPCFDGGWFIVGIDTPKGSYTYHYEDKYWNWFECEELPTAKHWDGHTEEDVTRLLTLAADVAEVRYCRFSLEEARRRESVYKCSACGNYLTVRSDTLNAGRGDLNYCPLCGRKVMHKGQDGGKDE